MPLGYIALGSNLGSREAYLRMAVRWLNALPNCDVRAVSPIYETAPVGPPQSAYLNAVARLEYDCAPEALLDQLLDIERQLGRERRTRWGPRVIDLDFLWSDAGEVQRPQLVLPHPHLAERSFVLAPLLDVGPELVARYGEALQVAGGAPGPAHAFAREPACAVCEPGVVEVWARDRADALADALWSALAESERSSSASSSERWQVQCFRGHLPHPGHSAFSPLPRLETPILETLASGFRVQGVVVSCWQDDQVELRLVGTTEPAQGAAPPVTLEIEELGEKLQHHVGVGVRWR